MERGHRPRHGDGRGRGVSQSTGTRRGGLSYSRGGVPAAATRWPIGPSTDDTGGHRGRGNWRGRGSGSQPAGGGRGSQQNTRYSSSNSVRYVLIIVNMENERIQISLLPK